MEWQSAMYAEGLPAEVRLKALTVDGRLPFVFEAAGSETHVTNGYDPNLRARRIFITTSSFSSGARTEAERINARIELIDGARLAQLILRHGVGVQAETTVTLHQLAEDFFEIL